MQKSLTGVLSPVNNETEKKTTKKKKMTAASATAAAAQQSTSNSAAKKGQIEQQQQAGADETTEKLVNDSTTDDGSRTPTPERKDGEKPEQQQQQQEQEKRQTRSRKRKSNGSSLNPNENLKISVDENGAHQAASSSSSSVSSSYDDVPTSSQDQPDQKPVAEECLPSSSTAPPPNPDHQEDDVEAEDATKKRRKPRRKPVVEEASRKSVRINKLTEKEAEVVDNYTGSKDFGQPRGNQIPVGLVRVPYKFPSKMTETGRLRIDMNGPATRSNPGVTFSPLKARAKRKSRDYLANLADLPECQEFDDDVTTEREEPIWIPPADEAVIDGDGLNDSWRVVKHQFKGNIPVDALLHRLMVCNYNVDKMLSSIEWERLRLPQPFVPFTKAQQAEFERTLKRVSNSTYRAQSKNFRGMQERFLRRYHLGEIMNYYYSTKKSGCYSGISNCVCNHELCRVRKVVPRYECENCTYAIRPNAIGSGKFCLVCDLFYKRNKVHRTEPGLFTDQEQIVLDKWMEMEAEPEANGQPVPIEDVLARIESKRVEKVTTQQLTADELTIVGSTRRKDPSQISDMLAPYEPIRSATCSGGQEVFKDMSVLRLRVYTPDEILTFVKAFDECGKNMGKVAQKLGVSESECRTFYHRFKEEYSLDTLARRASSKPTSTKSAAPKKAKSREVSPQNPFLMSKAEKEALQQQEQPSRRGTKRLSTTQVFESTENVKRQTRASSKLNAGN